MLRTVGMILLVGSLIMIGSMLVRFGTSSVASARTGESRPDATRHQAVVDVSDELARTVKYWVFPAGLLVLGGVLVRGGRRDDRTHELNVEADVE